MHGSHYSIASHESFHFWDEKQNAHERTSSPTGALTKFYERKNLTSVERNRPCDSCSVRVYVLNGTAIFFMGWKGDKYVTMI